MCGIAGVINPAREPVETIRAMMDTLVHRGPDSGGWLYFAQDDIALGHRRLSILDLSDKGKQPMVSHDGRYVIVFNGEIYNFAALKSELAARGVIAFHSTSDTEALLEYFACFGVEAALSRIEGMFAIGLYDRQERALTLMRDRGGEKPLYYGWLGESFVFASELKAIRAIDAERRLEIDDDAVKAYMRYRFIPSPLSIYKGIRKLTQGCRVTIRFPFSEVGEQEPYWRLNEVSGEYQKLTYLEAKVELKRLIRESVKRQMVTDVPYGAFLSGGIDSSLITAVMQENTAEPISTFTIGFQDAAYNEAAYAKRIADALGCRHTEEFFTTDELLKYVPRLSRMYDEPMADASQLPMSLVAATAKKKVTVCLSGDCGDELFLGYPYFVQYDKYRKMIPGWLGGATSAVLTRTFPADSYLNKRGHRLGELHGEQFWKGFHATHYWDDAVDHAAAAEIAAYLREEHVPEGRDFLTQMKSWDFYNSMSEMILCKVDRAAMAHSLETRVPLLSPEIIRLAMSIPTSYQVRGKSQKLILKDILNDYIPKELYERPKQGFGVPVERFLHNELREWAESYIYGTLLYEYFPFFDKEKIAMKWKGFCAQPQNKSQEFWRLCVLGQWLEDFAGR